MDHVVTLYKYLILWEFNTLTYDNVRSKYKGENYITMRKMEVFVPDEDQ